MKIEKINLIKEERKGMSENEIKNAVYNFTSAVAEEIGIKDDVKMFVKLLDSFNNDFIYKDNKLIYTENDFLLGDFNLDYLFMNENCNNIILKCTCQNAVIYGKLPIFKPITIIERLSSREEVIDITGINSNNLDILIEDYLSYFGVYEVEDEMDKPEIMVDLNDEYEFGMTFIMYDNGDIQDQFYWIKEKNE